LASVIFERNTLNIFTNQNDNENGTLKLHIFDIYGQLVLQRNFPAFGEQISLPVEMLSDGFYVLRAEYGGVVQTLRIIKS
jgi:hypothetical protein